MLNTDAQVKFFYKGKIIYNEQILLRRNVAGEYVIEIENAGEQLVIYPQSIQSFGPLKETEDRFFIEFKVDFSKEIFY